jgi:hypothetical protein
MIYWIVYLLFLIALFNLPPQGLKYLSLVFVSVVLTILFFYYRRRIFILKSMKNLAIATILFFAITILILVKRGEKMVFWVGLCGAVPYLWFLYEKFRIKQESPGIEEQRLALRTNLSFDVELIPLDSSNKKVRGLTRDISTTGMRVFIPQELKKGDVLYFRIYIPEESWPLTGKAEVVWSKMVENGYECGMVFTEISDQDRGKIALKQGFSIIK